MARPIYTYFFSYTYTILFCWKIKVIVITVFLTKIDHRLLFNSIYYKTVLVWRLVSVWLLINTTHCLQYTLCQRRCTYDIHKNCPIFNTSQPSLSIYFQNSLTPFTFHDQFQVNTPSPNDDQSFKRKHNPSMTIICYQVLPSCWLLFSVSTH